MTNNTGQDRREKDETLIMIVFFTLNKRYHNGNTCIAVASHFLCGLLSAVHALDIVISVRQGKIICKSASDCVYGIRRCNVFKDYALDPTVPTEGAMDGAGVLDRLGWP